MWAEMLVIFITPRQRNETMKGAGLNGTNYS